ncbi:uncharacterized protein (DUF2147 family) [Aquabacterium commune]|uniref:Uncharacterized protein (DUF2147 family) n=1 Tax=Aquabacterium commune TaxID=70586 RepID=A0A4R6RPN5_9BURK|nr:DUF2147 domain-containing protein [Aquabacterium commune]TDP88594.1 uncharacterized protein (DUF2147 family) [Aquabacterium commune]
MRFPFIPSFSAAPAALTSLMLTLPLSAQPLPPELFLPPFPELGRTTSAGVAASASPRSAGEAASGLLGRWVTASGNLEVEIAPCGQPQPQPLCGTVTRVLGHRSMARDGEMQPVDARPAVGMQILRGLTLAASEDPQASGAPWFGEIYNRENGRTYRCRVHLGTTGGARHDLVVRPYVFTPLFGQTQHWQRAGAELAQQAQPKETP